MVANNYWMYQGRQYHQWFGHGTAPKEEKEAGPPKPGSLFDPLNVGQRVDYASGSIVVHSPRDQRSRWEARISGANRESLKTAVAVWYGASKLTRDAFRRRLLDPHTSDETADRPRSAAKGIVDACTHAQFAVAGENLSTAAQTTGLDRRPRFLGDAQQRGVTAATDGEIPGVMNASVIVGDPRMRLAGIVLASVVLLYDCLTKSNSGPSRPTIVPT